MKVITVARKPLIGSVAKNVIKYGTGGLNIDACRIGRDAEDVPGWHKSGADGTKGYKGESTFRIHAMDPDEIKSRCGDKGRWPANVILEHKPECRCVGTKAVKPSNGSGHASEKSSGIGGDEDPRVYGRQHHSHGDLSGGFVNEDGLEEVPEWECSSECPVGEMDRQSVEMGMHGAGGSSDIYVHSPYKATSYHAPENRRMTRFGDSGGASRFFFQAQKKGLSMIPQDLLDYLVKLISPPYRPAIYRDNPIIPPDWEDNAIPGLIVYGTPTKTQAAEMMRVLKPGSHLLLIAPDEEPTGHTGTCIVEDEGFEIRDSILWVDKAGKFHYVAKTSRSERESGCEHLKGKSGADACDRQKGTAGLNNPRAGAGRTAEHVKNFHPTCKPIGIMRELLKDVPTDAGPVLDPFMGSGTTGLACLFTGHDFIGIEREEEYLEIADARVRYWEWKSRGGVVGDSSEIISDKPMPKPEPKSLDEIFGWGEDD